MNYVHIVGRLGADPEIHPYSDASQPDDANAPRRFLVRFNLAVEQPWRPGAGDDRPVDWVPILVFDGPTARYAERALTKGALVSVSGKIDTRRWTDDRNNKRKEVRVVAVDIQRLSTPQGAKGGHGDDERQHEQRAEADAQAASSDRGAAQ